MKIFIRSVMWLAGCMPRGLCVVDLWSLVWRLVGGEVACVQHVALSAVLPCIRLSSVNARRGVPRVASLARGWGDTKSLELLL